ncbi:hypothetical protein M5X04_27115 [Paenibacillus alvei]|uniref:Uncharacterized protein n=1 Tax=Paenibacillus alvei TaxID=44250 RepID=A0ABT4EIP6_PAEAL|nr:hypothetical protein [Paenibacillus alvei]MCY9532985.1 hypothetical protein [Paenibacillus alvei]
MSQKQMYPAAVNSPGTEITADITSADTTITVASVVSLPPAPNLLTVGNDETAETVRYTKITGNVLTVERGFQSEAKSWSAGTKVARYFTAYDHDTFRGNIDDHETRIEAHVADGARHVTAAERSTWNAKETPEGAQAKANQAETNAKNHANTVAGQAEANAKNYTNTTVGNLNQLQTSNKANLVFAVNEVFTSGVNAKSGVVAALNAMGVAASTSDNWETLAAKIRQITTGVKMAKGVTTAAEQASHPTHYVEVRGLAFRPQCIAIFNGYESRLYGDTTTYPGASGMNLYTLLQNDGSYYPYEWWIQDDGFRSQVHLRGYASSKDYNWVAFGG